MKKNKVGLYSFVLLLLCIPLNISASEVKVITYDLKAEVKEDKQVNINENLVAYFTENNTSFKKNIPLEIKKTNKNNKIENQKVKVINEKVKDNKYKISSKNSIKTIDISGKYNAYQTYDFDISYTLKLSKNKEKEYDELYFYIIDGKLPVVYNINFSIQMPKEVKTENISFIMNDGNNDTDISDFVQYTIQDKHIIGYVNKMFENAATLAIKIELPKDYFNVKNSEIGYSIFQLVIPFITLLLGILILFKYKKGNNIVIENNDYPPYNFDSAEISYLYNGHSKYKDIISLVILLANQGYINIHYSKNIEDVKLEKAKEYDKNNAAQKILFENIFKYNNIISIGSIDAILKNKILIAIELLDNKENKKRIFESKYKIIKIIFTALIFLSIISISFTMLQTHIITYLMIIMLCAGLYITISKFHIVIKVIGAILIIINLINCYLVYNDIILFIFYIIGIAFIIGSYIINYLIPKRTKYGNKMYGYVLGFKNILTNMSNEKLVKKIAKDNSYYYDMIPYTYTLNISDVWLIKKNNTTILPPKWLISDEKLQSYQIDDLIKNIYSKITEIVYSNGK